MLYCVATMPTAATTIWRRKPRVDTYAIWPFFGSIIFLLAVMRMRIFSLADTAPSPHRNRVTTLDGLRGYLALGVYFHHALIYRNFLINGTWELPPSRFYIMLGQTGVALFFVITGYLFWVRILAERGQPNWAQLYIGRIFRIGPLYLFVVLIMLAVVFVRTGPHLQVPGATLAAQLGEWMMLGVVAGKEVNGYGGTHIIIAGVTWSLRFEWLFYFSLLLTAFAARLSCTHLPFAAGGFVICLIYIGFYEAPSITAPGSVCAALFFAGMTCGSLEKRGLRVALPDWLGSAIVLALMACVFVAFSSANGVIPVALLGLAFLLIASGCTVSAC